MYLTIELIGYNVALLHVVCKKNTIIIIVNIIDREVYIELNCTMNDVMPGDERG